MDYQIEVKRMKEYYLGLEQAATSKLPTEIAAELEHDLSDPETEECYRETMAFWSHVFLPFYNTYAYIVNNRFVHEELEHIIAEVDDKLPVLSSEAIYVKLKSVNPIIAEEFIRTIGCPSSLIQQLLAAFRVDDQEAFCSLIDKNLCNLHTISHLCNHLWDDISPIFGMDDESLNLMMDAVVGVSRSADDLSTQYTIDSLEQMNRSREQLNEDDSDENFEQYMVDFYNYIKDFHSFLLYLMFENYDEFSSREIDLLLEIAQRPEGESLLYEVHEAYLHTEEETQEEPQPQLIESPSPKVPAAETHVKLPSDFFQLRCDSRTEEYLNCCEEMLRAGLEPFERLLDYLADQDYIANNVDAKRILAYRLTGKFRPKELRTLEWHGRNGQPYELIYLVRYLSARGDYRKMRQFFEGPQWVKGSDSSYAKSAAYEFRQFLHSLYPASCPL